MGRLNIKKGLDLLLLRFEIIPKKSRIPSW